MANINFVIPHKFEDLLKDDAENYYVQQMIDIDDLPSKIREARLSYKDEGVQYITDYFDTYYFVIHHNAALDSDKLLLVYKDLETAITALVQNIKFLLEDADNLTLEVKLKYQTIMKMLLYLFCNYIMAINNKNSMKGLQLVMKKRGRRKADVDDEETFDKKSALVAINMFLQCDIYLFWDPPVVEEQIINMVAEVCYPILENTSISSNRELQQQIFNVFGILLKTYSYDESFSIRLVQLLKVHPHLIKPIAEGIYHLVQNFNTKGLIGEFIREIMEFLMDEKYEDAEGTRNCTATLLEMSKLLPQLMVPEIAYLNNYLGHESSALRVAVLTVMSEVLIILGAKLELEDNEKVLKDFIPTVMLEHINDVAITVRSKVIPMWAKVQKENLLSHSLQNDALTEIVAHISDKGSSVRKNAACCVISFLEHNPYGSELSLKMMQKEYAGRLKHYQDTEENIKKKLGPEKIASIEKAWSAIEPEILKAIKEKPKGKRRNSSGKRNHNEEEEEEDTDDSEEENSEERADDETEAMEISKVPANQLVTLIKLYLEGKKYKDALTLCKRLPMEVPEFVKMREKDTETDEQFLLKLMKNFYHQMSLQINQLVDIDTITEMNKLEGSVKYYEGAVEFAKLLEEAMPKMMQLLTSVNITEMQEAVKFFVTAYQFKLDGSDHRVLDLLEVMKLPYEERKTIVVDTLVEVFLVTTFTNNMREHVKVIVDRLISFIRIVTYDYRFSFQEMIAQWTLKGKLDNSILDMLFSYFTKKENVTNDQSLAALQVLTLAAHGRKSIVTNNLKMVCEVVFQNRGLNDMVLLAETCNFLAVAGTGKQRIDDNKPPYRLSYKEPVWDQLANILYNNFSKNVKFYDAAIAAAIRMIYNLCSKPEVVCQNLVTRIMSLEFWATPTSVVKIPIFYINRLNLILGNIALYETAHLDDTVYTEIKRRSHKKVSRKSRKKSDDMEVTRASARKRASKTILSDDLDESILEGAQAEDTDAQFVLNTLEFKIVTNPESLGAFTPFFMEICQNLNRFPNEQLQCGSILVLLRYTIMSNQMCRQYVELIFKILATTQYTSVKQLIIINLADLLARFPNVIDPYSSQIFERLSDSDLNVQKTTYFILANLLTRNMLRVNKKIYAMVLSMVPEDTPLSFMAKQFFTQLAKNQQAQLYNVLPDMFSFLCARQDVPEEQLQYIMRYFFDLMDKSKHMEGLVDRFCAKLINNEDGYTLKNVGFCLHLIQYNDKSARKLADNFPNYKDAIHNTDLHAFFKQIMAGWSKATKYNLKDIAVELEGKIMEFFQIRDIDADDNPSVTSNSIRLTKSARKPGRGRKKVRRSSS